MLRFPLTRGALHRAGAYSGPSFVGHARHARYARLDPCLGEARARLDLPEALTEYRGRT